jgi:hypothetical protein
MLKTMLDYFRPRSNAGSGMAAFRWRKHVFPRLVIARPDAFGRRPAIIAPAKTLAAEFFPGEAPAAYQRTGPRIENAPPEFGQAFIAAHLAHTTQAPAGGVAIFNNASIAAGGVILDENGRVVAESLLNTVAWKRFGPFARERDGLTVGIPPASFQQRLSGPAHIMLKQTYDTNYGHWLLEGLPRILAAAQHCDLSQCRVIVSRKSSGISRVYVDTLKAFGVRPEQIVTHKSRPLHVDRLIYPLPISEGPFLKSPMAIQILESLPNRLGVGADAPKRIYVSRGDKGKRRLLNENAVLDVLQPLGFVAVQPGALDLQGQARMFSQAEVIIGNCGAGLTNAVFAPRGNILFALTSEFMPDDFFWDLADLKQSRFFSLHGRALDPKMGGYSDFEIDIEKFRAMLAECLT